MRTIKYLQQISLVGLAFILFNCIPSCNGKNDPQAEEPTQPPHRLPKLVRTLPHDETAFTQGLFFENGKLYESTGLYGKSTLRILDSSGAVTLNRPLPDAVFAEGCALLSGTLFQITWRENICFMYALPDLVPIDTVSYSGEGWGLTGNDTLLIMSDGSDTLYFRNNRFEVVRRLPVTCGGIPLVRLNELEYARGHIYANVWFSDFIFEINPENGSVERIFDCSGLVAREAPPSEEHVLNGIAYDPGNNLFYLTGKNWKNLFIVTLPEQ